MVTKDVPAGVLVVGAPARVMREQSAEAMEEQRRHARRYRQLAEAHARRARRARGTLQGASGESAP
ncbi:MAG: hypothetical protein VKO26_05860 [Cyanobacteriota bacterium]|nr:hypothetical protein [Cyanobacteriota bacterium]